MMKTTNKGIKELVKQGMAKSLNHAYFAEIERIRDEEGGFDRIAYASGASGITAKLAKGRKTGTLYAVTDSYNNIYQL